MNSIKNLLKNPGNLLKIFRRIKKTAESNTQEQPSENKENEENKENKENKEDQKKNKNKKKESFFSFLKISQGEPMIKEEAMKILNFSPKDELNSKEIMERFEKYFLMNEPEKGGSYYLQNKVFYAKEFLMKDFPKEENKSIYNLDNKVFSKTEENLNEKIKI